MRAKHAEWTSTNLQAPKHQPDPHNCRASPKIGNGLTGLKVPHFLILGTLFPSQKCLKYRFPSKPSKIWKRCSRNVVFTSMLIICRIPFCINFHYNSWLTQLVSCSNYNAKCLLLLLKASHSGIPNLSNKHVCSRHLPGHPYDFILIVRENDKSPSRPHVEWFSITFLVISSRIRLLCPDQCLQMPTISIYNYFHRSVDKK